MEYDQFYTDAVLYCYEDIKNNLHINEVIPALISTFVITVQEKQDLEAKQIGYTSKCEVLLDLLFDKKRNMKTFLEVLKEKNKTLAAIIEKKRQEIICGRELGHIQVIQQQVKSRCKENHWNIIEKLPGEKFTLDISDDSQLMPLDFSSQILDLKFMKKIKRSLSLEQNIDMKYQKKELDAIEDIFVCDEFVATNTDALRLVLCTGIAGIGKSVTLRRFAWQWSINSNLCQFDFVFVIPLANVKKDKPIVDILGRKGLNLIDDSQKHSLHQHIVHKGEKVLFALDGGDEIDISRESELSKLITGKLYPKAKVFITVRSNSNLVTSLKADAKIHISGTSRAGIYQHIKASVINTGISNTNEVDYILEKCRMFTSNIDLLYVPLYLTLFTILFDQHLVKYASLANFKAPETMTELYNNFMCVIIKIWLKSLDRIEDANGCIFEHSPFNLNSKVPVDIRGKLFCMGRMSFECLMANRRIFTDSDCEEYFVDVRDVRACGMFCANFNDEENPIKEFYFRHQTFQEYLTALYLSHVKFKHSQFRDHILKCSLHKQNSRPTQTLEEILSPLQQCMKFLFGLAPSLGVDILSRILPCAGFAVRRANITVLDLVYESELYSECEDEGIIMIMAQHLNNAKIIDKRYDLNKYRNNFVYLHAFIKKLPMETSKLLLQNVYKLEIVNNKQSKYACIAQYPAGTGKLVVANLDTTCFSLLSHFVFPYTSLTVEKSMIFNVGTISKLFPKLKTLDVSGSQIFSLSPAPDGHEDDDELVQSVSKCLTNVKLHCNVVSSCLPLFAIKNLLAEDQLEVLHVDQVNILEFAPVIGNFVPKWELLKEFNISNGDIYEENFDHLHKILSVTHGLQKLQIQKSGGEIFGKDCAQKLMDIVTKKLPHLVELALINLFDQSGVEVICMNIPQISQLRKVGIGELDIMDATQSSIEKLAESCINKLDIHMCYINKISIENKLTKLTDCNIKITYLQVDKKHD